MDQLEQVSIRLVKEPPLWSTKKIEQPVDAVELVGNMLFEMDREVLCVLNLRTDGKPINFSIVSIGAINQSIAEPRELFKASILSNAASMLMVHNHPSGSLNPSKSDVLVTDRMVQLCNLMGIPLLDHIIVGGDNKEYFSFKSKGIMPYDSSKLTMDYKDIDFEKSAVAEPTEITVPTRHRHR